MRTLSCYSSFTCQPAISSGKIRRKKVEVGIVHREEFNILRYEIPIVPFAGSVVEHIGLSGVVRERFMWWLSLQTSQTCKLRKKRPEHS